MTEWLTIEEASAYLKVTRRTLYRLMETGRLPYYQIANGGRRRIKREDLDALLVPGRVEVQKTAQGRTLDGIGRLPRQPQRSRRVHYGTGV